MSGFLSPGFTPLAGDINFLLSDKLALKSQSLHMGVGYSIHPASVDWVYWGDAE